MRLTDVERGTRTISEVAAHWAEERQAREKQLALLRRAISKAGTQRELARRLGLSRVQVTRWMRGDRPVPEKHLETLRKIAGGGK